MKDADIIQNIPIRLTAILIATVSGSADTQKLIEALGQALLEVIERAPFVASVQAIQVSEVHVPIVSKSDN